MLRHYDEIGLLAPCHTDRFTGYRYYNEDQLPRAGRINALKEMGFGLCAISDILKKYEEPEELRNYLMLKRAETEEEAQKAGRRLLLLETAIQRLGKDGTALKYDVIRKELPGRTVASVRQIIPAYDQEAILWKTLMEETASMEIKPSSPCYTLAVFHDSGYKESDVDVEIQKSVEGSYPDTEHVVFKKVPPIQMASATYQGSYDQITEVNRAVAEWVLDNGYEFNGNSFCIYHVSPYETQNPDELVTEVCFPVCRK